MKVYVAGASKEIIRAERWVRRLQDDGIIVMSTWTQVIRAVGKANPVDATPEQYKSWVQKDLDEVAASNVLWFLLPEVDTVGAFVELGYAHAKGLYIVTSGQHRPIFTPGLTQFHSHYDQEIAEHLKELASREP